MSRWRSACGDEFGGRRDAWPSCFLPRTSICWIFSLDFSIFIELLVDFLHVNHTTIDSLVAEDMRFIAFYNEIGQAGSRNLATRY